MPKSATAPGKPSEAPFPWSRSRSPAKISEMSRIYLDNAATSFPKPEPVYQAVDDYQRRLGASAGRGGYRSAAEAGRIVDQARSNLSRLFAAEAAGRFAFACNGTDALNSAIHGLLRPGDHVVTTAAEHNSVLRPLRMHAEHGVEVTILDVDAAGRVNPDDARQALRPTTRMLVVTHASNVTGAIQPVQDLAEIAREAGVLTLLDAAQTAGHLPIDLGNLPIDLLACPGHKGLLGPLGTGVLYVRPGLDEQFRPLRQGGTGTLSESDRQPETMPELLEAGNLNVAGLAGLAAGTGWLLEQGLERVRETMESLTTQIIDGLKRQPKVTIQGDAAAGNRVGVVSLSVEDWSPADLAGVLDAEFGIETRAGLHCAPRMHARLGTLATGGTLRVSVGPLSQPEDAEQFLAALAAINS